MSTTVHDRQAIARRRRETLFARERGLKFVGWTSIAASLYVLIPSVIGMAVNPDFAIGDDATAERVLGVDMNGWHALSGILIGIPGLAVARRPQLAAMYGLLVGGGVFAAGLWALINEQVAVVFYLPNQHADAALHFLSGGIYITGAAVHYLRRPITKTAEAPRARGPDDTQDR